MDSSELDGERLPSSDPDKDNCPFSSYRVDSIEQQANRLSLFAGALHRLAAEPHAIDLLPDIIHEADQLGISRARLAKSCQVTEPTISRWASRSVQPHFLVAQSVLRLIGNMALSDSDAVRMKAREGTLSFLQTTRR